VPTRKRSRGAEARSPERKLRALKREEPAEPEVESDSTGAGEISAKEYPVLLERVYRAEKFPKPRNMVGMVKGLPVEEMEKLILANSTVDEEDLRSLADRRAKKPCLTGWSPMRFRPTACSCCRRASWSPRTVSRTRPQGQGTAGSSWR
jgi:hypothetical protein